MLNEFVAYAEMSRMAFATEAAWSGATDVAVVDTDYDGYVDRAYAADTGGNVYRIDFEVAKTCSPVSATCGMTKSKRPRTCRGLSSCHST